MLAPLNRIGDRTGAVWRDGTVQMASLAIQVHGGMGFIEETGVAQTLRDARIASIYEGTTAIQANDLLGRKLRQDRGAAMALLLGDTLRQLNDEKFYRAKLQTARFYAEHLLPETLALMRVVQSGGASVSQADTDLI